MCVTENAALGGGRDEQQEAEEEKGLARGETPVCVPPNPEVMSCQSDNKLQMEAGSSPSARPRCVCARVWVCVCQGRASGIYVLTFLPLGCGLARRVIKTQSVRGTCFPGVDVLFFFCCALAQARGVKVRRGIFPGLVGHEVSETHLSLLK